MRYLIFDHVLSNSRRYAESEEVRDKKKEYNKLYWAKKQLAKKQLA